MFMVNKGSGSSKAAENQILYGACDFKTCFVKLFSKSLAPDKAAGGTNN
jgi:hypothetical protein